MVNYHSIIETQRLHLLTITPEVLAIAHKSLSDAALMSFLGISSFEQLLLEKQRYARGIITWRMSFRQFLLFHKEAGIVIGSAGYHTWYTQHNKAEIGYALSVANMHGKGYMTEALDAIIAHGFEVMKLVRIEAMASPYNQASLRLLEKYGFIQEGLLRSNYLKENRYEDSALFSLLLHEYVR